MSAYNLILQTLAQKSASLHEHITGLPEHDPDLYLDGIFTSLFTEHLALDEAARLWDVYVFEGDAVLVRAAVALLLRREMALLGTGSIAEVRTALEGGSPEEMEEKKKKRVLSGNGEEDRWMRSVREAGKS